MLNKITPSQPAEWLPAKVVMLCEPRLETLYSILQTESSNFLRPFSLAQAREEHRKYRRALEERGALVFDIREALREGGSAGLRNLRTWAREAITLACDSAIGQKDAAQLETNLTKALSVLDAESLVDVILMRPTMRIAYNADPVDPTTRFTTRFELTDPPSCYYTRDPLITTAKGVVITRLRLSKRKPENDIVEHALKQIGIKPIYRVQAPGTLEGGDFMPCGDFVLQGQGLLTNAEGVRQCLEHKVYGFVEVGVVKDQRNNMDEMHLDTYFAMLDKDLAACCDTRLKGVEEPLVDVYAPVGNARKFSYALSRTVKFSAYLKEKGITVIPFTKREQENFAPNGLLVGPRQFIGVKQSGAAFEKRLQKAGVQTQFISFDALTGGYGGPHCSSQVLVRN
jgi:arginine deiminase